MVVAVVVMVLRVFFSFDVVLGCSRSANMASHEHSIRVRDAAAAVLIDTTVFIYWHHTGLINFLILPHPRVLFLRATSSRASWVAEGNKF